MPFYQSSQMEFLGQKLLLSELLEVFEIFFKLTESLLILGLFVVKFNAH